MDTRPLLIHCRRPPYGSSLARAGIELAMAAAAFEQPLVLLFSGDGIWQLLDHQHSEDKNHGKLVSALPIYGVSEIIVDEASLHARGLSPEDLCLPVSPRDKQGITQLLSSARHILTF